MYYADYDVSIEETLQRKQEVCMTLRSLFPFVFSLNSIGTKDVVRQK